jgi:hypothetical protein
MTPPLCGLSLTFGRFSDKKASTEMEEAFSMVSVEAQSKENW